MIEQHLPIFQIVVPLLSAPLCVLVRTRQIVLALTITVCWLTFGMSTWLLMTVLQQGVVSYELLLSEAAPTEAEPQPPMEEGSSFAELERAWLSASEQQARFGSLVAEITVDWMRFLDPASRLHSVLQQSGRESRPTTD